MHEFPQLASSTSLAAAVHGDVFETNQLRNLVEEMVQKHWLKIKTTSDKQQNRETTERTSSTATSTPSEVSGEARDSSLKSCLAKHRHEHIDEDDEQGMVEPTCAGQSDLVNLQDVDKDPEINVADEEVSEFIEIDVAADSGAGDNVASKIDAPGYEVRESNGSKAGQKFVAAGGHRIKNEGEMQLEMKARWETRSLET